MKAREKAGKQLSTAERLRRLFTSLCAQIDGGHLLNAIKTCDKSMFFFFSFFLEPALNYQQVLRIDPADPDAQKTKLFLLLQTEQYDTALPLIDADNHRFELAYALYRLQREDEALHVLGAQRDRASLHLLAQINYRTADYAHAVQLYTQLLESAEQDSEEHTDILVNLRAAQSHYDFITTGYLHALGAVPASLAPPLPNPLAGVARGPALSHDHGHEVLPHAPKKPRAKRVPPGVVPGVTPPPDPERWLKKSERASASASGRKRRAQGGGVTQGSVAVVPPTEPSPSAEVKAKKGKKRK